MSNTPPRSAHKTAFLRGQEARKQGLTRDDCPYDLHGLGGSKGNIATGARGFARAWLRGWDEEERKLNPPTPPEQTP